MFPFSPIALQQLHEAGWTEDRRIDISDNERTANGLGIELFAPVREFLTRFGNLELHDVGYRERCSFSVMSNRPEEPSDVQSSREELQRPVQYIGIRLDSNDWEYHLAMDESGAVFEIEPTIFVALIGVSGEDAIQAVLIRRPYIKQWYDKLDWRKIAIKNSWMEHIERTGIVPPVEVIDLLYPEVQQAIRKAAHR